MRRSDRRWFYNPQVNRNSAPDTMKPVAQGRGNLISSKLLNGKHSPILDLDFAAMLVESTNPGHYHLYLDGIELDDDQMDDLIESLVRVGILQEGILRRWNHDGAQFARPPWVKKPEGGVGSDETQVEVDDVAPLQF